MGLIPVLLASISKPLEITYKVSRLALRLKGTRKVLGVADHLVTFTLDLKGKIKLSLALLLLKLVHGKLRCQKLASQCCKWLDVHRKGAASGDSNERLLEDLNDLFCPRNEVVVGNATPLTRAGLLFLRDCLDPIQTADKDISSRFIGPGGQLDVRAALTAFYGTATAHKLADVLAASSVSPNTKSLMLKVYDDLRYALRRDLTEMFILALSLPSYIQCWIIQRHNATIQGCADGSAGAMHIIRKWRHTEAIRIFCCAVIIDICWSATIVVMDEQEKGTEDILGLECNGYYI
ncbi:hypothetical protein VOLCADRAFT_103189 [Volvox carteri f. nagariensis]|uniref:Uncharacterized protein n=1 Tax=Volvox carteri f. nagariensis TaxID=3068 RepID=D8TK23_VOLCA|nr:uncharacterized protein VOLCADRAFT_103189 [Volvox carteri f. nagariensis]EFJ51987.1 hypothetical protein VOLCADRAFT_103189 [Volvox carteri f. nagariensis]|eukprot:XP_002946761.1 hypothetical protein VOLCADRAFT_103189 [Volvox carteri f. nagariensis]